MRYRVTEAAPPRVAGRAVQAGDVLDLTEPAARFELLAGHLIAEPADPGAPVETPAPAEAAVKPASKRR
ncbi:hypothetical protein C2U72_03415 [Prosthecomicrobium hirschii]|uniref:hypothetical protein n=1 Tax=Prosthecodimorpha hirschii TaxID=665126 RepID=UPI001126EF7D|nr:hypothetical protein [Prosthecomicrobium hirschii]TPQ52398.1 hypothetical protein C2U72_03415 [Prosthecomicrobium hirschii]